MREIIIDTLVTVGSTLIIALIGYGFRLVSSKIATEKAKAQANENNLLAAAFTSAETVINATVNAVVGKIEQVTAGALREAVKNGTADRKELVALARTAYNEVIATISPTVMEQLEKVIYDSEQYILDKIENSVRTVKLEKGINEADKAYSGVVE